MDFLKTMQVSSPGEAKLRLEQLEGVTACFVNGSCEAGYDPDHAIVLRPQLADTKLPYMAIHNHTNHWCRPVFGEELSQLPEKLVSALLLRSEKSWQYFLPVCADTFKTAIRGCEGGFEFYMYPNCKGLTQCRYQLAFVCQKSVRVFSQIR